PVLFVRSPRPPRSTLFPYTTLFRSMSVEERTRGNRIGARSQIVQAVRPHGDEPRLDHVPSGVGRDDMIVDVNGSTLPANWNRGVTNRRTRLPAATPPRRQNRLIAPFRCPRRALPASARDGSSARCGRATSPASASRRGGGARHRG